jgi:hypothetical protein
MTFTRLACAAVPLLLSMLAVAQSANLTPEQRVGQVGRDGAFLEMLVDSSLVLAAEDDPLKRAQVCNDLAEQLAKELRSASAGKERATGRVVELGNLLQDVLVRGVADNLSVARFVEPVDPARSKEVAAWSDKMTTLTRPVEETLKKASAESKADLTTAMEALTKGRGEVEKIVHWKGPPPEKLMEKFLKDLTKSKGKGKGLKK